MHSSSIHHHHLRCMEIEQEHAARGGGNQLWVCCELILTILLLYFKTSFEIMYNALHLAPVQIRCPGLGRRVASRPIVVVSVVLHLSTLLLLSSSPSL